MLESKRLIYQTWNGQDFNVLKKIMKNPNFCLYLPGNNLKTDEEIKKWLHYFIHSFKDDQGTEIYKVVLKENLDTIGYCGLGYVKEVQKIEIMYGIDELYWRNGYGLEMSLKMKNLAKERKLDKVVGFADINNIGSNKILLYTGFSKVEQITLWGLQLNYYEMDL
jgi:ribosomal-protein-alanine N-acetyltransferase